MRVSIGQDSHRFVRHSDTDGECTAGASIREELSGESVTATQRPAAGTTGRGGENDCGENDCGKNGCGEMFPGCILGGVHFDGVPALEANSDGDVVLHAITNAVSGITCRNILGKVADEMCRAGITDSREYLKTALTDLAAMGSRPVHLSITIECARPKISPKVEEMRRSIGALMHLPENAVGITATTGEGLTDCGKGLGISVFCVLTAE